MKTKAKHITLYAIRIFLMLFWLYVALDKLWGLEAFHFALKRQPFPIWVADLLYWSLPLVELAVALLFVIAKRRKSVISSRNRKTSFASRAARAAVSSRSPFGLSALLLFSFTVYIALGVAGFYSKLPCGCASVFRGLSWEWHLLVNIVLLGLSTLGWYLIGSSSPFDTDVRYKKFTRLFCTFRTMRTVPVYHILLVVGKKFPRKFALFTIRPILHRPTYTLAGFA